MEWFCTEELRSALRSREKKLAAAFRILAAAAAIAFVVLCLLIRTDNAQTMHFLLIAVTAVFGWICIALRQFGIREVRAQLSHLDMLLEGQKDFREGTITLTRESIRIPKSIRIRKVLLENGAEDPLCLNLDEQWVSRIPPDGSRVRLAVTHSYIAGAETLEDPPAGAAKTGVPRKPAGIRKAAGLIPLLGIWLLAAVILGSYVFYQITDTDPAHKITVYMDGQVQNGAKLAARLENELGKSVRMVQVRPFSYFMFGSEALKTGDLFVVPDTEAETYRDWFSPDDTGWTVYDPAAGVSVAGETFLYSSETVYRLYTGASSPHLEDGLARRAAELLISLETEKEETE